MPQITDLKQSKKGGRIAVYVDQNFVCFLSDFTVFKNKLCVGQEIEVEELKNIQLENEQDACFDLAIKYISKYTKTEKEIKDYLLGKGFLPELCEKTLEKLKDYKYINDQTFANNFVSFSKNKYGKNKIKMMLKQKGVNDEILNSIEFETDFEFLESLAKKYLKNKDITNENLQKCAKFLYGRGFSWEDISKVIEKLKQDV